jgi:DNA invertase Pin-like site-specific DNA recombinase
MGMARSPKTSATRSADAGPVRALAYIRVSTDQQVESGAGMDAQRSALTAEAERRGWHLEVVVDAGLSGKDMRRPALVDALDRLDRGQADVLLATKLDRVSRSVADFARLLDRAHSHGWRVVLLDLGVDTATPAGEFVANTLASAAQYERRLISQRTKDGLAAKRAAGVRLGRPAQLDREIVARIVRERAEGRSLPKIAAGLSADSIPTARGGKWYPSTIAAVLNGQDAAALAAAGHV